VRVSSTTGVDSADTGEVTTGTVTSVLEAAFARGAFVAGAAATGAASVFGAGLVVLVSFAILFALTEEEEEGISNAVGMLTYILTCLNHIL